MRRAAVAVALSGLLLTTACGGSTPKAGTTSSPAGSTGSTTTSTAGTTASTGPSPTVDTNYLPVPPGITLTTQGARLQPGQAADVAWVPRQNVVAAAALTVKSVKKASLDLLQQWNLPPKMQTASLYFVNVRLRNLGTTDLGKLALPVYAAAPGNVLIQASTFAGSFQACPSGALPAPFPHGARKDVCLLYLVPKPGKIVSVTFRPSQDFNPITWAAKVTPYKPKAAKHRKH